MVAIERVKFFPNINNFIWFSDAGDANVVHLVLNGYFFDVLHILFCYLKI